MINLDFSDKANQTAAYKQLTAILEDSWTLLCSEDSDKRTEKTAHLFNRSTHAYLIHNAWEILLPAKPEQWNSKFKEMNYDSQMPWPQASTYNYTMEVIAPPFIPSSMLPFGYAFVDDKPVRSAFFVIQGMVDYQVMPQGFVIDPLVNQKGIKPSFYFGCTVEKEDIHNFLSLKKNPLEAFVEKTNKKEHEERIYTSRMDGYYLQMQYRPDWFSEPLMKFAVNEDLPIPDSEHNDKLRAIYERAKEKEQVEIINS